MLYDSHNKSRDSLVILALLYDTPQIFSTSCMMLKLSRRIASQMACSVEFSLNGTELPLNSANLERIW